MKNFKNILFWIVLGSVFMYTVIILGISEAHAKPPSKSKFYDFNDQLIDGKIRKPTALYTSVRQKARFDRLLKLKKSFLPKLFQTSKEKLFK